jgi:hypothetical protein
MKKIVLFVFTILVCVGCINDCYIPMKTSDILGLWYADVVVLDYDEIYEDSCIVEINKSAQSNGFIFEYERIKHYQGYLISTPDNIIFDHYIQDWYWCKSKFTKDIGFIEFTDYAFYKNNNEKLVPYIRTIRMYLKRHKDVVE